MYVCYDVWRDHSDPQNKPCIKQFHILFMLAVLVRKLLN